MVFRGNYFCRFRGSVLFFSFSLEFKQKFASKQVSLGDGDVSASSLPLRHIWWCISLPNLAWPASFSSSVSPSFFFLPPSFCIFLSLPGVLLSCQETCIFPQSMAVKAEPLFPTMGEKNGKGGGGAGCQFSVLVSLRKRKGDRFNID